MSSTRLTPRDASKRGPDRYYGDRFKFSNTSTHCAPDQSQQIIHEISPEKVWHITIDRYDNFLMKGKKNCSMRDKPLSLFRITVKDEYGKKIYSNPLWLVGARYLIEKILLGEIFNIYNQRFNIEHWFRFAKRHFLLDKFETTSIENAENWLLFPLLATHMLYHARELASNCLRPWESSQSTSPHSPPQIKRAMEKILQQTGTPAEEPVLRGIGKGRARDCHNIHQKMDSEIHLKSKNALEKAKDRKIIIKLKSDSLADLNDVELIAKNLPKSGQPLKNILKHLFEVGEATLDRAA